MENEKAVETPVVMEGKRSIGKLIFSISLIAICSILVIGITLCSFLTKNFNPGLNDPDYIVIKTSNTSSSSNNTMYSKNTDEYKKLMELYNNSFETTLFTAMFQGISVESVSEQEGYKSLSSLSGTYIEFNYTSSQTMYVNGQSFDDFAKERQDKTGTRPIVSNTDYISVFIEVKNTTSLTEVLLYFRYRDTGTNNYSYIRLKTYAVQNELYDYVESL